MYIRDPLSPLRAHSSLSFTLARTSLQLEPHPDPSMGIPTELVGSLPRPKSLQKAYAEYDAGIISHEELIEAQDSAVKDSLDNLSKTGETLITDGEQRASSFATYPITDTLAGTGLAKNLAADGQYFAIFNDGHHRQLPRLVNGPFAYKTYAYDNFKKSQPMADGHAMKQAVIAPSMMYLLYPLNGTVEGYSKSDFEKDLVNECEKDIRGCFEAGAKRVSIDFTEGRLAAKNDKRNPWTGAKLLQTFIDLNNRVLGKPHTGLSSLILPQQNVSHRKSERTSVFILAQEGIVTAYTHMRLITTSFFRPSFR